MAGREPKAARDVRVLSADWVVPVEGPPIRDGAIAIEDGVIVAVAAATEIGEGERYRDAVILPGFVNAHSHLEYAVYGGFGDGLSFGPWIARHVERKARIDLEDMKAIARFGAEAFDVVFTDLAMPRVSGWQVARAIKEMAPAVPVFLVTGFGVELSAEERRAHGVDAVLVKPLKIQEILDTVALIAPRRVQPT